MSVVKGNTVDCDSVRDLVRWIEATPRAEGSGQSSSYHRPENDWDLSLGLEGAVEYGKGTVWEAGVSAMVKGTAVATSLRNSAPLPSLVYDVAGFLPSVPMYLAGCPDHMLCLSEAGMTLQKPSVSIALSGFSAYCTGPAMVNRGVAFMSLVDALETDGTRCEVYFSSGIGTEGGSQSASMRVCIKRSQDHWTPASAAFSLAHPGFFRRLWFAAMERFSSVNKSTNHGYGPCTLWGQATYTFAVPYQVGDGPYETLPGALKHVEDMAKAQGFEVKLT